MTENKRDKFERLAVKRVNNALSALRLIGNLSSRTNYDYSDSDVDKIFDALSEELRKNKARFSQTSTKKKAFKL